MGEDQPLAPIVDHLGVTHRFTDSQQVTEMVIIMKVLDFESGETHLGMSRSNGCDWIGQRGLIYSAVEVLSSVPPNDPNEED